MLAVLIPSAAVAGKPSPITGATASVSPDSFPGDVALNCAYDLTVTYSKPPKTATGLFIVWTRADGVDTDAYLAIDPAAGTMNFKFVEAWYLGESMTDTVTAYFVAARTRGGDTTYRAVSGVTTLGTITIDATSGAVAGCSAAISYP